VSRPVGVFTVRICRLSSSARRHATSPAVPIRCLQLACFDDERNRNHLLVLRIESSDRVHSTTRDEVFLRAGDETRRLTFDQRQELLYDKGQASFEHSTLRDETVDRLDQKLLGIYASAVGHSDPIRLLQARGLVTRDRKVSVGCLLLFGDEPQQHYPEAYVRVMRYRGSERGTGSRQNRSAGQHTLEQSEGYARSESAT